SVAEVEPPPAARHDVQPDGEAHERPWTRGLRDVGGATSCVDVDDGEEEGGDQQDAVHRCVAVTDSFPQVEACKNRPAHFSGTRMPRRPVGLKTRTPIRMPNTTTCVHLDPR